MRFIINIGEYVGGGIAAGNFCVGYGVMNASYLPGLGKYINDQTQLSPSLNTLDMI